MSRDERVYPLRDGRKYRHIPVEREPDGFAVRVAERQEAGFGGARTASIGREVLHGSLKLGSRDRRMLLGYLLKRLVVDLVDGEFLPIVSPIGAKGAIAVVDQQRPQLGGRLGTAALWIFRLFRHVFSLDRRTTAAKPLTVDFGRFWDLYSWRVQNAIGE